MQDCFLQGPKDYGKALKAPPFAYETVGIAIGLHMFERDRKACSVLKGYESQQNRNETIASFILPSVFIREMAYENKHQLMNTRKTS